jgi:hypothetical protein
MRLKKRTARIFTKALPAISLLLTSIHGGNYHFYAMDGIDSELNKKEGRAARKRKFL